MGDDKTNIDERFIALLDAGIKIGMSNVPSSVPSEIRNLAEQAVARAMMWVIRQIEPSQIRVLVDKNASATAEIDWGNEPGKE